MLRNIEEGNRCFIIGTGPSINSQDLTLLKNECVIGISGLYCHKDLHGFMPNYYVNPSIFKRHLHVNTLENHIARLRQMDSALDDKTIMFFHTGDKHYIDKYELFKNKTIIYKEYVPWNGAEIKTINLEELPDISSVSESAIQIALYLGFKEIILIGFDHNWFEDFYSYFDTKEYIKFNNISSEQLVSKFGFDSELQMRRHAKMFYKYKRLYSFKRNIFNANANQQTYVDVFPKVSYEALFSNKSSDILNDLREMFTPIESWLTKVPYADSMTFSRVFNKFFDLVETIRLENTKVVVYGYGKIAKTIELLIPEQVIAFVDKNVINTDITKYNNLVYPISHVNKLEYEKILISVSGREEDIINTLVKEYGVEAKDIIYIK